jgi:hypothetical protein
MLSVQNIVMRTAIFHSIEGDIQKNSCNKIKFTDVTLYF